jgi:hypothetical protein
MLPPKEVNLTTRTYSQNGILQFQMIFVRREYLPYLKLNKKCLRLTLKINRIPMINHQYKIQVSGFRQDTVSKGSIDL